MNVNAITETLESRSLRSLNSSVFIVFYIFKGFFAVEFCPK